MTRPAKTTTNASVLFIEAPNDANRKAHNRRVSRVQQPLQMGHRLQLSRRDPGSYWYLIGTDKPNDDVYIGFCTRRLTLTTRLICRNRNRRPEPEPKPDPKPEVTPK